MVQAKAVTSKIAVQERLPDLNISDARTTSSAIHNIDYLGPLCPWPNFLGDVEGEFLTHNWANNRHRLYLRPLGEPTPHSLWNEHCLVGNETGVQGRWQTHLGEVMSAVFQEQQFQLAFADFVSSGKDYNKNPDLVMVNVTPDIMVVGELKVPWIEGHDLDEAILKILKLRRVLGQILAYMYDLEVKFGILSNYEQILFLRLHEDPITGREVQYSPVIYHDASYSPGYVTVRQCIWFLAEQARAGYKASNLPSRAQWIRD
ncbi:hypothetical protein AARAC_001873 [Aspergillus arachidicola]|uniref:Uncharacterized protein n=1 Tax=Aspergillus arachidicola TaxID=656916 RepID=A0A2G7GB68_9EURO|nr:hypothetical protein AARAC_001873 [Aspergillus arachidicola]